MKKALIPAAILCTAICIGVHTHPQETEQPITIPDPPKIEVTATATPEVETEITVPEIEESIVEVIIPEPTPTVTDVPTTTQTVQAGDMVYVPGFGWIESQGEGTVTYDENMYENGNKVGIMG